MKRALPLLFLCLLCFQSHAQIECDGMPTPMPTTTYSPLRSASSLYTVVEIDTTQRLTQELRIHPVGHVGKFNFTPANHGIWTIREDGMRIWRMGIISPGATAISVVIDQIDIPNDAKFLVYNPTQTQVLGAFDISSIGKENMLPIRPLMGDSLILEYQEPMDSPIEGTFRIERIAHNRSTGTFNASNKCSPNALFTNDLPQQKQAVCLLYIVSDTQSYYASGCLINNTEGKPYVYTAAHNLKSIDDAPRTVFYFNYAVTAQDSTIRGTEECTMAGSIARAWATDLDMALLELTQMPPKDYRIYMAGWTRTRNPQAPLISIQHPLGDSKKMSYDYQNPVISNYNGYLANQINNGWWYIAQWEKGVTEKGSSGSPLFEQNGRIIGALTGGSSTCAKPIGDFYARLDTAWNHHSEFDKQLAHWLSPNQSDLQYMDGIDPYATTKCERLQHIQKGQTIAVYKHKSGYYSGHNLLKHSAFAEKYTLEKEGWVYGVYVMPALGYYNANVPVYLCIYSGADAPQQLLSKTLVKPLSPFCNRIGEWKNNIKLTWSDKENYVRLKQPIAVPQQFYVGVEIQYDQLSYTDSLVLYNTIQDTNHAFYKEGTTWKPFSQHSITPINLSLWIEPVISYHFETSIEEEKAYTPHVYPNPTTDKVYWEDTYYTSYYLYTLQGKLIAQGENSNSLRIPDKGIYLLYLHDGKQHHSIHKVIRY